MRTLGVDYGEKRVGFAISDATGTVATPLVVLDATPQAQLLDEIRKLVDVRGVEKIVIGLPVRMDGGTGPAAEKAKTFGERLHEVVPVPVLFWDERFSTVSAEHALIEGGARRQRRKQVVDKLAAQIILQHYLDAQSPPYNLEDLDETDFALS